MSTETELVLSSLTKDELRQAFDFVLFLERTYGHEWSRLLEPGRVYDERIQRHVLDALAFAVLREVALRYGAEPWFVGMPTEDHPHGPILELYQQRASLNTDTRLQRPAHSVERRPCHRCRQLLPHTADWFEAGDDGRPGDTCRVCTGTWQPTARALESAAVAAA